jgi:aminopeptidase-like protein
MTSTASSKTASVAGERMYALAGELYPICRSITGDGVRATLRAIGERIPLEVHEVPSGTEVLDWTVPDEWNIRDAWIKASDGTRVVDFRDSNLHVVGYSEPIRRTMTLEELRPHLHTHAENPAWIPFRHSYYTRTWGFCLPRVTLDEMEDGVYDVLIDSTLEAGSLTYGECFLAGSEQSEVLFTTHVCHPSLANDNCSGVALLTELASALAASPRRLSYRLLFVPATIGPIAWLATNEDAVSRIVAGMVVACVGDSGPLTYKRSRRGDTVVDRAGTHVISQYRGRVIDFTPWGYDDRQFGTPGFKLPVGALNRSFEGEYPEYHSSADNLDVILPQSLEESLRATLSIVDILEQDRRYLNLAPKGEPQLGKRGLYRSLGGPYPDSEQLALLWVLNQSDGTASLLDIAERSGLPFAAIHHSAQILVESGLLAELDLSLP